MKRFFYFILLILILFQSTFAVEKENQTFSTPVFSYERATVLNVYEDKNFTPSSKIVKVLIRTGKHKGQIVNIRHIESAGMMGAEMKLKKNDKVIVYIEENPTPQESPDGSPIFNIADYDRSGQIIFLILTFSLLILLIGGRQGAKTLISLLITLSLIFLVIIPLAVRGYNPLLVATIVSAITTAVVFRLVSGKSIKSVSAALGTTFGLIVAALLSIIVGNMMNLSGLSSEESKMLFYSMDLGLNYKGILFAGIIIGALGAVMDVAMSIASSINEVKKVHPEADLWYLFKSGLTVGRDIMGTMSNTLILAYTGSSLPLLLLLSYGNMPFLKSLNLEIISEEILRAFAGSIGLILSIPATSLITAFLLTLNKKK